MNGSLNGSATPITYFLVLDLQIIGILDTVEAHFYGLPQRPVGHFGQMDAVVLIVALSHWPERFGLAVELLFDV